MNDDLDIPERPERAPQGPPQSGSAVFAWLELVRLPNVFTAWADVAMGFLITRSQFTVDDRLPLGLLIAASSSLYMAGMALNDAFDAELDARERPERPIPSGRISLGAARRAGWSLLVIGVLLATAAGVVVQSVWPAVAGLVLAGCVVLYDRWLKPTPFGPLGMGLCRVLNVVLGMSAATAALEPVHGMAAAAIGVFIAGVTWFSRSEARKSNRGWLLAALAVILGGLGLMAWMPAWAEPGTLVVDVGQSRWKMLMGLLAAFIGFRSLVAIADPSPRSVQAAVRQGIQTLVFLDAAAVFAFHGPNLTLWILLLIVPVTILGQWLHST